MEECFGGTASGIAIADDMIEFGESAVTKEELEEGLLGEEGVAIGEVSGLVGGDGC